MPLFNPHSRTQSPGRTAILTVKQATDAILNCLEPWQDAVFAEKYGVTKSCIRAIRTDWNWTWRRRELEAEGRL